MLEAMSGPKLSVESCGVVQDFGQVLRVTEDCACIAIDIPIGLTDGPTRDADREARRLLGWPRRTSVFSAPPRPLLQTSTYAKACAISLRLNKKKISRQTFGLLPKIRQVDEAMSPVEQGRVIETHPEVGFWALNGRQPVLESKKAAPGMSKRRLLLQQAFAAQTIRLDAPSGSRVDDVYDSCVAAWTAFRYSRGEAERVPLHPPKDRKGLRMEIVF